MPPVITSDQRWLSDQIEKLWGAVRGQANQTTFVIDPTVANPSAGHPNCVAIIGALEFDNFGNATGLSGWGIASKKTGSWVQL